MKKIAKICGFCLTCCLSIVCAKYAGNYKKKLDEMTKDRDKIWKMFDVLNKWMNAKIAGSDVEKYLKKKGYINIAVYGMSNLGQTLINDLEDSSISIKYGIDRDAEVYWDTFPIITPDEVEKYNFDEVDAVVVTAISFFEDIRAQLSKELKCPIISLKDII